MAKFFVEVINKETKISLSMSESEFNLIKTYFEKSKIEDKKLKEKVKKILFLDF